MALRMRCGVTKATIGADYVVRAEHPRRGGPLRITDKAGHFLAQSGDSCASIAPDLLASMIQNGYVERVSHKGAK